MAVYACARGWRLDQVTVPFSAVTSGEELLRLTAKVMALAASPRGQKTALGTRVVKSLEQVGGACQGGMSGGRGLVVAEALVVGCGGGDFCGGSCDSQAFSSSSRGSNSSSLTAHAQGQFDAADAPRIIELSDHASRLVSKIHGLS